MENENLNLWEKVKETNPNFTKKVSYGAREFTTVNAQYQLEQATKEFGMYGKGFGIESIDHEFVNVDRGQILVIGRAIFFYVLNDEKTSFPISSTIFLQEYSNRFKSIMVDDDFAKKLETDILTKSLSKLGFAADIFQGRFDDNKYFNDLKKKYQEKQPPPPPKKEKSEEQKKDEKKASKKGIEKLFNYAKNGDFDLVFKNFHYAEANNVLIDETDKKAILDIIEIMQET